MLKNNLFKFTKAYGFNYTTVANWLNNGKIPDLTRPYVCLKLGLPVDSDPIEFIKSQVANDNEPNEDDVA